MPIKAVFFDWFGTLARYEPAREEAASQALKEFGYDVAPERLRVAIAAADRAWFEENTRARIRSRDAAEQARLYARHQQNMLKEVGVDLSAEAETFRKLMARIQVLTSGMHFVLFDDVVPAMKLVKDRKLKIGLLSNMDQDMHPLCRQLGIDPYLDLIVTSGEIGVDKPKPPMFIAALQRAGVKASEAVHIGDQYQVDVVGARGVGIKPLLIDRYSLATDVTDCPRLKSLTEIADHLDAE